MSITKEALPSIPSLVSPTVVVQTNDVAGKLDRPQLSVLKPGTTTAQMVGKALENSEYITIVEHRFKITEFVMVILAILSLAITIILARITNTLAIFTRKLWESTKDMVDGGTEMMIANQRPWVSVDAELDGPLLTDTNGNMTIQLAVTTANLGKSPATNVVLNIRIFMNGENPNGPTGAYEEFFTKQSENNNILFAPITLFPGHQKMQRWSVMIDRALIGRGEVAFRGGTASNGANFISPAVIGFVQYNLLYDKKRRHTGFIYALKARLDHQTATELQWGGINTQSLTIPKKDLLLSLHVLGAGSLD